MIKVNDRVMTPNGKGHIAYIKARGEKLVYGVKLEVKKFPITPEYHKTVITKIEES